MQQLLQLVRIYSYSLLESRYKLTHRIAIIKPPVNSACAPCARPTWAQICARSPVPLRLTVPCSAPQGHARQHRGRDGGR